MLRLAPAGSVANALHVPRRAIRLQLPYWPLVGLCRSPRAKGTQPMQQAVSRQMAAPDATAGAGMAACPAAFLKAPSVMSPICHGPPPVVMPPKGAAARRRAAESAVAFSSTIQQDSDRLKAGRHGLAIGHSCPAGHGLSIFTRA